jgi:E3 ubiquitin-protein ligase TRIP12
MCGVLQSIMVGLKQADDESAQLTALTDLCEHLSISTEESLATFPVEQVVPLLVRPAPCLLSTGHVTPGSICC